MTDITTKLRAGAWPASVARLKAADEIDRLRAALSDLVDGLDKTNWSSWQTTAHFWPALENARAILTEGK